MSAASGSKRPRSGWESLKVDELKAELEARGLPKSGNKDELIARLEEADAASRTSRPRRPRRRRPRRPEAPARGAAPRRRPRASEDRPRRARTDGAVVVTARAKYVRSAPRKARLVMDHIRGKRVEQAQAILGHAPRARVDGHPEAAELGRRQRGVRLRAGRRTSSRRERAFVDEGPTIKRYRPRALGRATRINKRTSHMTIELTTTDEREVAAMGQKVHPESLRVGYIHDWKSTWFNEREFSDYLLEDLASATTSRTSSPTRACRRSRSRRTRTRSRSTSTRPGRGS